MSSEAKVFYQQIQIQSAWSNFRCQIFAVSLVRVEPFSMIIKDIRIL